MGRDNQPKHRQLSRKEARSSSRPSYDRILIVTEGSKTEPLYLEEIRIKYRLQSANVVVQKCQIGTAPIQVVNYAKQLFEVGDAHQGIRPRSFDQIYAVFDRDDHPSFFEALKAAQSLDKTLRNDEKQLIKFQAITSIPSFELWLLLHYEDVQSPIHRNDVVIRLKRHIPGYEKGLEKVFARTSGNLEVAKQRARALAAKSSCESGVGPLTDIHELVDLLINLASPKV